MDELLIKIEQLKKEKDAVILAHYYTPGEVQMAADYIGDSFYLAKEAQKTDAQVIVFCGVAFMGESAKILNPEKTVIMPDLNADCPMAHMASEEKIQKMRELYEDLAVVCYINSTAKLKSLSDVCVTSSNALKIVKALPNKNIFFIPDGNLGRYVKEQITDKNIILNDGYCPIHADFNIDELKAVKNKYPDALVLSHPECKEDILAESDYIGSTAEIITYSQKSECREFIVCTEEGVKHELKKRSPEKEFYFVGQKCICTDMKLNTLKKLCSCLENLSNEVILSKQAQAGAIAPLERMLEMGK